MKLQQYKDILLECLVTLRHSRTFVTSCEKMHPTGVELYDKLVTDIESALTAPGPEVPTRETLPIPDFVRNQGNLRAERAEMETRSECTCREGYPRCAAAVHRDSAANR